MTMTESPLAATPHIDTLTMLPVAVIGAGPIGLAAAAQLLERGIDVVVLERGATAGAAIQSWGHTRLFSPWEFLVDEAAARILATAGWTPPTATHLPYGHDLVTQYLLPLAATPELRPRIYYSSTVTAVSRQGMDRTRTGDREKAPFLLRVDGPSGTTEILARAIIDASGTYSNPNSVLSNGLPVTSSKVQENISHALPDVLGAERERFASKHTLVVGAGHSAANTLLKLAQLADEEPGTSITWAVRSASPTRVYGSDADQLPARGELGSLVHELVRSGKVTLVERFEIDDVVRTDEGRANVAGRQNGQPLTLEADVVVNATGFRPDLDMLTEIRLSLDEIVQAPTALAGLIDPNVHSCGTVYPHGVDELSHPEPNFFIAGMKSYGRAPTFLLLTGYEQVRSIADELAGNSEAARIVQVTLPETGVCSTATPAANSEVPVFAAVGAGSCATPSSRSESCCG